MQSNKSLDLIKSKHPHISNVRLSLPHQTRFIGKLDEAGEGTFHTKRNEKHLFRKTQSLGINLDLLMNEKLRFKWVVIIYCGKKLTTSRLYFLKYGKVFTFQKAGMEPQVFLSLNEFGYEKAKRYEDSLNTQCELFPEVA